jgi:hypothetical protein
MKKIPFEKQKNYENLALNLKIGLVIYLYE